MCMFLAQMRRQLPTLDTIDILFLALPISAQIKIVQSPETIFWSFFFSTPLTVFNLLMNKVAQHEREQPGKGYWCTALVVGIQRRGFCHHDPHVARRCLQQVIL